MLGGMRQPADLSRPNPDPAASHPDDATPGRDLWFDRHTQNLDAAGVIRGGVFDGMTHPEALAQRDPQWALMSQGMQNIWDSTAQPAPASATPPDPAATRQAITAQHIAQVMNPGATVDAARLVREAGLAADGVRDLGGGNRMINNPHATGVAVTGAPPTPGPHVFDDGRPVDLAASKQAGTITYGTGDGLSTGQLRSTINNQVAALVPGADDRLKKDRDQEVQNYTAATAADRFNIQNADGNGSADGDC